MTCQALACWEPLPRKWAVRDLAGSAAMRPPPGRPVEPSARTRPPRPQPAPDARLRVTA